jgi:hypothetical protein
VRQLSPRRPSSGAGKTKTRISNEFFDRACRAGGARLRTDARRGFSQAWSAKPVTLVVPFPPGGGTDAFARPLSAQLSKQLGKQVIIDNKGSAGGTVGASFEPPRFLRRLQLLRRWSHEQVEGVFT